MYYYFLRDMSNRSDSITLKMMPNGNVRAYRANTPDKAGVSELQITWEHNIAPTVTTTHGAGYVMQYEDEENH